MFPPLRPEERGRLNTLYLDQSCTVSQSDFSVVSRVLPFKPRDASGADLARPAFSCPRLRVASSRVGDPRLALALWRAGWRSLANCLGRSEDQGRPESTQRAGPAARGLFSMDTRANRSRVTGTESARPPPEACAGPGVAVGVPGPRAWCCWARGPGRLLEGPRS